MRDSSALFARLRQSLSVATAPANDPAALFTLGVDAIDARLGGGLARGGLHEIFATHANDAVAANGFALMLALRAGEGEKPVIWLRSDAAVRRYGRLYGPGIAELGGDPASVIQVLAADDLAVLRAGADSLACAGVGTVIIEIRGKARILDLTATRRLALAAARSGVTALLVRAEAEPMPSAAATRWQVAAAPSLALAGGAPGYSRLTLRLLRHRSGHLEFTSNMEWNRDKKSFATEIASQNEKAVPALPRAVPAAVNRRPRERQWRLAG
jgi:protein ImuA